MRLLLSTIGSRGDVQPLVALAFELRALGQDVRLCVPPDFRTWIEELGFPVIPIGPELRSTGRARPPAAPLSADQLRQLIEGTLAAQFDTIMSAADGCDAIVGATALQVAAPSVAEALGIPYIFAAYCPAVLPSPDHAPPVLTLRGDTPGSQQDDNRELWARDARRWDESWRDLLNAKRAALGLSAVDAVRDHVLTTTPWLAADPTLAPWPDGADGTVMQTGAWILRDTRALPPDLQRFLDEGEPPVYFGFGSVRAPDGLAAAMIGSARALGRRAVVSRGWAGLSLVDAGPDCIAIDDVNQQHLFPRVAAVVHHGGAGTTTASARAGAPQVVVPQHYDQHYWAGRVRALGIGTAHTGGGPTIDSLAAVLALALDHEVARRARAVAAAVRTDGARVAAERLVGAARGRAPHH